MIVHNCVTEYSTEPFW